MEREDQSMCEHKIYRRQVLRALGALGGACSDVDLLVELRDNYSVPISDAFIALADAGADGVLWDQVEHTVEFEGASRERLDGQYG